MLQAIDLSRRDHEPVACAGSIQPHGALLVLREPDLIVVQASANCPALLGAPPLDVCLGRPLHIAIGPQAAGELRNCLERTGLLLSVGLHHIWSATFCGESFDVFAHKAAAGIIVEFERRAPESLEYLSLMPRVQEAISRLQESPGLQGLLDMTTRQIRGVTNYDRVVIYKFMPDHSGQVVAESLAVGLQPHLGLHFPATDIPAPARQLLALGLLRHMPDVNGRPVPILPEINPVTGSRLDQSRGWLRSIAGPCIQFNRNMGVRSTFIMPLLSEGTLWGVISCKHESASLHIPYEIRKPCQLLSQTVSLLMAQKQYAGEAEYRQRLSTTVVALAHSMSEGNSFQRGLTAGTPTILDFFEAGGAALASGDSVIALGATPSEARIRQIVQWLAERNQPETVFQTSCLAAVNQAAADLTKSAAGLLAVRILPHLPDYILWFRPEVSHAINWAGDPEKPVEANETTGELRLAPRRSFAVRQQNVAGRSAPWLAAEIEAAKLLQHMVGQEILVRQSQQLAKVNQALADSNRELSDFANTAAHDIMGPLRVIELLSGLLQRKAVEGGGFGTETMEFIEGIHSSAGRLRPLVRSIAEFGKIGRGDRPCVICALADLVEDVKADLKVDIEATGATILHRNLPSLMFDRNHLRQVLQNLVANSLKYRHPSRSPVITIAAHPASAPAGNQDGRDPSSRQMPPPENGITLVIADNGTGFDPRHNAAIFEPFLQLHSKDDFAGSGLGLAICSKLIARHGGTITAEGHPGEGAIFIISLPAAARVAPADLQMEHSGPIPALTTRALGESAHVTKANC